MFLPQYMSLYGTTLLLLDKRAFMMDQAKKRQLKSQAKINIGFHIFRPRLIESSLQGLLTFQHFCVVCDVMHREISCHAPKTKMFLETLFFGT